MTVHAKPRLTVDQFIAWSANEPKRYELFEGEVYAMPSETSGHADVKGTAYIALRQAVRRAAVPCHVLPDGATVRIDDFTAFEPDALVYCGDKLPPATIKIPSPVIVVEVLSPSSHRIDATLKLSAYFRVPSIAHYLIVDPNQRLVVHHARGEDDAIVTRIVRADAIPLDPPGLELRMAEIYES